MEQNKAERLNENVTEKMCSSDGNVVGEMCSPADADTMVLLRPRTNGFLQMCFVENGDLRVMLCQTGELLMTV